MKVSVIGATGYAGAELVKILLKHPMVNVEKVISKSFAGERISNIYPSLVTEMVCEPLNIDKITSPFVFTALPHGKSMEIVAKLNSMEGLVSYIHNNNSPELMKTYGMYFLSKSDLHSLKKDLDNFNSSIQGLSKSIALSSFVKIFSSIDNFQTSKSICVFIFPPSNH